MSTFTPSGSGGIPLEISPVGVINPTVTEVTIVTANTEQPVALPANTVRYMVQVLSVDTLYVADGSGLPPLVLPRGTFLSEDDVRDSFAITLYVQSPSTGLVARIKSWTS